MLLPIMICYILHSSKLKKYYVGFTTEDIKTRIQKHNTSFYGQKYTSQANDWSLFLSISCESTKQMLQIEKHIKRMKSKVYIENLLKYPELVEKLIKTYRSN